MKSTSAPSRGAFCILNNFSISILGVRFADSLPQNFMKIAGNLPQFSYFSTFCVTLQVRVCRRNGLCFVVKWRCETELIV